MRQNPFVFIGILALLLILAGCTKAECRKDTDCVKPHFTGACVDKKCSWNPVPNECGNSVCDGKENECTCPQDCGSCTGKLGKYLVKQCNAQNDCTADIPAATQKPITLTRELQAAAKSARLLRSTSPSTSSATSSSLTSASTRSPQARATSR
jgi:hypothetical protein